MDNKPTLEDMLKLYSKKELWNRIQELTTFLEENDKEIERLKEELHTAKEETLHFQNKYFAENQRAIEELEKIKSRLRYFYHDPKKCLNKDDAIEDFEELIDERISALKAGD